jgi:hypothetical protein
MKGWQEQYVAATAIGQRFSPFRVELPTSPPRVTSPKQTTNAMETMPKIHLSIRVDPNTLSRLTKASRAMKLPLRTVASKLLDSGTLWIEPFADHLLTLPEKLNENN